VRRLLGATLSRRNEAADAEPHPEKREFDHDVKFQRAAFHLKFHCAVGIRVQGAPGTTHCWSGRFYGPDGPLILPVTYQFRNGSVIFRTSPVGPLAGLVRRTNVAFEIDGFDEETKSGWSVLIRGFAEAVPHNYLLTSAWESGPVPWAEGIRNVFIEIKPHKISGRAVQGTHGD